MSSMYSVTRWQIAAKRGSAESGWLICKEANLVRGRDVFPLFGRRWELEDPGVMDRFLSYVRGESDENPAAKNQTCCTFDGCWVL